VRATPSQFAKVISRNCPLPQYPEVKMWVAVWTKAWEDAQGKNSTAREDAIRFFMTDRVEEVGIIGLDAEFVRELFVKHSGIFS